MPEKPLYNYQVSIINGDALSPNAITRSPRIYKPQDLLLALGNQEIVPSGDAESDLVGEAVRYLLTDFFVFAHRTGLYNRQRAMWESLTKVVSVTVFQHSAGVFKRTPVPRFDVHFRDYKEKTLVLAHLIEPGFEATEKQTDRVFQRFLAGAQKLTGSLTGLFFLAPKPFPQRVLARVHKLTDSSDPVARYESILPEPLSVPIDLLEFDPDAHSPTPDASPARIRLIHPDLSPARRIRVQPAGS